MQSEQHFNSPAVLPPVGCEILIKVGTLGAAIKVVRVSHVAKRGDDLHYVTPNGLRLEGQFPWTYP